MVCEWNTVEISGIVTSNPIIVNDNMGNEIYEFEMKSFRRSDAVDTITVHFSKDIRTQDYISVGDYVFAFGSCRSYNAHPNGLSCRSKLIIYLFCEYIEKSEFGYADKNDVFIVGTICRKPGYRVTPKGRAVSDFMVSAPRRNGMRSDYIPCIAWGDFARLTESLDVGQEIRISGRMQSRLFRKWNESRTVKEQVSSFEISCNQIDVI